MKHFMIKYQFANGTPEEWHREIGRFITALDGRPSGCCIWPTQRSMFASTVPPDPPK